MSAQSNAKGISAMNVIIKATRSRSFPIYNHRGRVVNRHFVYDSNGFMIRDRPYDSEDSIRVVKWLNKGDWVVSNTEACVNGAKPHFIKDGAKQCHNHNARLKR
jgi:uncharacterized membrane protein